MATLNFTYPDEFAVRVRDAYCAIHRYQPVLENADGTTSPNPETKIAFTKRMIAAQIKETVKNYEAEVAAEQSKRAKEAEINSGFTIS